MLMETKVTATGEVNGCRSPFVVRPGDPFVASDRSVRSDAKYVYRIFASKHQSGMSYFLGMYISSICRNIEACPIKTLADSMGRKICPNAKELLDLEALVGGRVSVPKEQVGSVALRSGTW